MILRESAWYSKAYFFIESWWAYALDRPVFAPKNNHRDTNLCQFMRTFVLKLPIILASQVILYGGLLTVFLIFPMSVLGFTGYAVAFMIIGCLIGGAIGGNLAKKHGLIPSFGSKTPRTEPSFWYLTKLWYKARKEQWCPMINIEEDKEDVV